MLYPLQTIEKNLHPTYALDPKPAHAQAELSLFADEEEPTLQDYKETPPGRMALDALRDWCANAKPCLIPTLPHPYTISHITTPQAQNPGRMALDALRD